MKIVQVLTSLEPAEAERIVSSLSLGLLSRGHQVSLVCLQAAPSRTVILDELKAAGLETQFLGLRKNAPWRALKLRGIQKRLSPDIVHAHLLHANIASRIASIGGRSYRLLNTVHIAERRPERQWQFKLDSLSSGLCDCHTAVSKMAASYHAMKTGLDPKSVELVYNGIRPPLRPSAEGVKALRISWGLENCSKVLGSVGRLDWQKGYDLLLGLLGLLSGVIPKGEIWGLVILGEGPQRPELESLAARAPANLKVLLPGFRADAAYWMGAFDLFLMPSRYEGFGLTLAEAMAHGIPVLTSSSDSLPELLEGYTAGESVDFEFSDKSWICRKIAGAAGWQRCKPSCKFTLDTMIDNYMALYEKLLGGK